jgi:hypothetical protein
MTAPAGSPDYIPATWALGYQTRQFGVAQDPAPSNASSGPKPKDVASSILAALANPPASMVTSATDATGVTQTTGKSTVPAVPPTQ